MSDESLSDKYRPKTFGDFQGQGVSARMLSNLINRGKRGRSLLLHGSVGSGKTSFAEVYGRALNCDNPANDGSPCLKCEFCKSPKNTPESGFYERDVSASAGNEHKTTAWLEPLYRPLRAGKKTVLFLDECHSLDRNAQDALLIKVERAHQMGVCFIFATTEPLRLRSALRSRLFDVEVRALSTTDSVGFLGKVAEKEGWSCERDALVLLAGLKSGFPRDLLNGLEQLHEACDKDDWISVKLVREVFDVDQSAPLLSCFKALALGDLEAQTGCLFAWREPIVDKLTWIQSFLTTVYFNDILALDVITDPMTKSIRKSERMDVLQRFADRFHLSGLRHLAPYWRSMMDFWPAPVSTLDDAAANLQVALFHRLVNHGLADLPEPKIADAVVPGKYHPSRNSDPYFNREDVRDIFNRASYLNQEHNLFFNALIEVRPHLLGAADEVSARRLVHDVIRDLGSGTGSHNMSLFAHIVVFERDQAGVYAHVLAHFPELQREAGSASSQLDAWCQHWGKQQGGTANAVVLTALAGNTDEAALRFHWKAVRKICAGMGPDVEDFDPATKRIRSLCKLLNIAPSRVGGPVTRPRIVSSANLDLTDLSRQSSQDGLKPLSPFDDQAWTWIDRGWERQEFHDRTQTRRERKAAVEQAALINAGDPQKAAEAQAELKSEWDRDAKDRERSWLGWWWDREL